MSKNKLYGPDIWKRDQHGLLESVSYEFNKDGSVNWRAMINPEHLYPNKEHFEMRKMPVPESIEGLEDNQLLIKLGGIKELLKLRGVKSVGYSVEESSDERSVIRCVIDFIPNYENQVSEGFGLSFSSIANATVHNTNGFAAKFLECIAENRAFVRTVRNFLGIHIVGADEMDSSKNKAPIVTPPSSSGAKDISPQGILKEKAGTDFNSFLTKLRKLYVDGKYENDPEVIKTWKDYKDVPAKECRKLLKLV
tara:strand:- start:492 stop:1244 length:753 start_codon:yes stop_codon:yes gene_type:complete